MKLWDQFGHLATRFSGDLSLSSVPDVLNVSTVSVANGEAVLHVGSEVPANVTVTLVTSAVAGLAAPSTSVELEFIPGAAVAVGLSIPVDATVDGDPLELVVKALDQFGNTAESETGQVALVLDGASVTPSTGLVQLVKGRAVFQFSTPVPQSLDVSATATFSSNAAVATATASLSAPIAAGQSVCVCVCACE